MAENAESRGSHSSRFGNLAWSAFQQDRDPTCTSLVFPLLSGILVSDVLIFTFTFIFYVEITVVIKKNLINELNF